MSSYQTYAPSSNTNIDNDYDWHECFCCPYGYHIDLDFVRYCESISREADNRTGSFKRRKDRRRQRQSMEVLLGLTPPVITTLEQHFKTLPEQKSPKIQPAKFAFVGDGFDDAVSDFEKTLQRSKHKVQNNLPDVTAVSVTVPGASMTIAPTTPDGPVKNDFDTISNISVESCGLSPLALQNIREQMALSLERTKELEDQVKQLPELKAQVSALKEENRRLMLQMKSEETTRINLVNANYIQPTQTQYKSQRSQSFSNLDNFDNLPKKGPPPPPPPRKDFGVMCGVLMRNIGVGHQSPKTKSVSTSTFDNDFADKWLQEKMHFLNREMVPVPKQITISRETQTKLPNETRDVGLQFKFETPQKPKFNSYTQTVVVPKTVHHVGVLAKVDYSNAAIQKSVECCTLGVSDDTVSDIICEKCRITKKSIAVGPESSEDTHTSQISLASLTSRSKSFNLGEDCLNLTKRTRTTASQYESKTSNRSCQSDIKLSSSTKSCQASQKVHEKHTQYDYLSISRYTDTIDLIATKKHVAVEAKQPKPETKEMGCNTSSSLMRCSKCDKEKEKEDPKDAIKKDGGSPTPSRIPRPQIPTTPVEIRKFRRQDTYTKIYSPTEKSAASSPTSPSLRLSGLDLSPKPEESPLEKVKQNLKIDDIPTPAPLAQNGINSGPITKVHVQEITLPVSESTIFQTVGQSQNRKKAVPSKEMQGALKVLNDALHKSSKNLKNHSAINIVQQEWFKISSLVTANPLDVEDYLDALEDISSPLLEYVVNLSDSSGNTAMHYAVSHGNFDVVSILLDSKVCDINKQNKAGYTSVMLVSLAEVRSQTHANVVKRLFKLADVNIRAKQHGQTALMLAVSHGRLDMVKMLLEAGADINIQDEDGSTALMCAAEHGHIEIVKHFLCQPDCDSSITDVDGSTALKIAMEAGHRHIGVLLYAHERNIQKLYGGKLKRTKSVSPKSPSSPLPVRSSQRALTETKKL